ncbi:hypothetical protein PG996_004518 [Apiospora saccharicola]|uniref:DUF6604 domain-containing protein n=1 Tax=Apiospora saccharicola TaxID=335842 RepID=A0ABR1W851_9PEZI
MAAPNLYKLYKRDTKHLLYWLIKASNNVIRSLKDAPASLKLNTDGKTTVAGILAMAYLVGEHMKRSDIPDVIFYLFQAVIRARTITHEAFSRIDPDAIRPDANIQKKNAAHKHFIKVLSESLEALGGPTTSEKHKNTTDSAQQPAQGDLDELVRFANKFRALSTDDDDNAQHDIGTDSEPDDTVRQAPKKHKKTSKGRKSTKAKGKTRKSQKKGQQKHTTSTPSPDQVDLEDCCIIEDDDSYNPDYCMAILALVQEWIHLRGLLQSNWCVSSYDGANSAVAAGTTRIAFVQFRRSEAALAIDFPRHDDYYTILNRVTGGDHEQKDMPMEFSLFDRYGKAETHTVLVDVKEQLLIHTYQDLMDFLIDFQKTRSGKPTKSMLARIRNCDPGYNLQQASPAQRVEWRRSYIINWLYDLVNVYSAPATPGSGSLAGRDINDGADWSASGTWSHHRGIFGLNEFAAEITSLAMQKPGSDVRHKIMSHHVFELQCIVDSYTVSRGWVISFLHGHRPRNPPVAFSSKPLKQVSGKDHTPDDEPIRHEGFLNLLEWVQDDFIEQLGGPKHLDGLASTAPSRFPKSQTNGLWEFSPFLCGAGLLEGLEISHGLGRRLWDDLAEPILFLHIYNLLLNTGYLKERIDFYTELARWFFPEFWKNGSTPQTELPRALLAHLDTHGGKVPMQRRPTKRAAVKPASEIYRMALHSSSHRRIKTSSTLSMWRRAEWNPNRITDEEAQVFTYLFGMRLSQTKHEIDLLSGETRLQNTPFVSMAEKNHIRGREGLMKQACRLRKTYIEDANPSIEGLPFDPQSGSMIPRLSKSLCPDHPDIFALPISSMQLLGMMEFDLRKDIHGGRPLSGLNLVRLAVHFISAFKNIVESLREQRNPTYIRVYEADEPWDRPKPVMLTYFALRQFDKQCLRTMAEVLENSRPEMNDFVYFEDVRDMSNPNWDNISASSCNMM